MTEHVWRVYATLQELDREEDDDAFTTKRVSTLAGLTIGETEKELEYLANLGGATAHREGELAFSLTDATVEDLGSRHDSLEDLDRERRNALLDALENGNVDPATIDSTDDARDAADRALGTQRQE